METMVTLAPTDLAELVRRADACERAGITAVGVGDSPGYHDTYVSLAVLAQSTSSIRIGPMVTNVVTRAPQVTAGAIKSIDNLAGAGRAFVGFGAGDSALVGAQARPAGVAGLQQGVDVVRRHWQGSDEGPWRIVVAANGPRTLRMAAATADVVVFGYGVDDTSIDRAVELVDEVRREQGHAASLWVVARMSVCEDRDSALTELRPLLASAANHVFASAAELSTLDERTAAAVSLLRKNYDYSSHGRRHENPNANLVDELGLREELAARFAIAGPAGEIATRLADLSGRGVDGVVIPAVGLDADRLIENLGSITRGSPETKIHEKDPQKRRRVDRWRQ
ncbi:5,10-methylenetetrahydromethanopterin reductase [Arthrobacter ginsengisoli]|uniref:5,10-methylenetetrahydromethanopterin reductase n=1 Tax=Arthrobacter ginsengisoli TaxID=1356565 RepID=A0ABU1UI37_9MICC|nr:LLM class flavin-dependent oxidoreductase [Arthrobacter ginsengisoli]MDR7084818.1 5,10-methylenetetrahydromethanopterin reductase [Arthrobacter ginsengisoli]